MVNSAEYFKMTDTSVASALTRWRPTAMRYIASCSAALAACLLIHHWHEGNDTPDPNVNYCLLTSFILLTGAHLPNRRKQPNIWGTLALLTFIGGIAEQLIKQSAFLLVTEAVGSFFFSLLISNVLREFKQSNTAANKCIKFGVLSALFFSVIGAGMATAAIDAAKNNDLVHAKYLNALGLVSLLCIFTSIIGLFTTFARTETDQHIVPDQEHSLAKKTHWSLPLAFTTIATTLLLSIILAASPDSFSPSAQVNMIPLGMSLTITLMAFSEALLGPACACLAKDKVNLYEVALAVSTPAGASASTIDVATDDQPTRLITI